MRMTKQRTAIIDLFEKRPDNALSAEMIYQIVGDDTMNLSTVYRNMDKLLEEKMINKTMVESTAYFYLANSGHNHFMICTNYQKMIPIGCLIKKFLPELASENHFKITGHDLTIFGLCEECTV